MLLLHGMSHTSFVVLAFKVYLKLSLILFFFKFKFVSPEPFFALLFSTTRSSNLNDVPASMIILFVVVTLFLKQNHL